MSSPPGSTVSTPRSRRSSKRNRDEVTSSPTGTPSKRGRSEDASSVNGTPSRRSTRGSVNGTPARQQNGAATPTRGRGAKKGGGDTPSSSVNGTPGRRSTRGKPASDAGTPRRSKRGSPSSKADRPLDSSPGGDLAPMPSSPASGASKDVHETSLFSSPGYSKVGNYGASEIDMSSPLNYGTPSSRMSGTPGRMAGTPIRPRNDIRSERKVRQVNLASDPSGEPTDPVTAGPTSDAGGAPQLVIWGTDVVVSEAKERFCRFLNRFIDPEADEAEGVNPDEPLYLQKLDEIQTLELPFLNVNCKHLQQFDDGLYRKLVSYPQEVIPTFDMAVNEMFFERYPDTVLDHQIQVRTFNAEKTKNMRSLNPEDIDQLITISGMVIRTSNLMPEMREAFFRCYVCQATAVVEIDRGRIAEPAICRNCQTKHSMGLIHNRSQFSDKQMVKLQESPDDMPAGQTPHTVVLYAHNDLVDSVQPGDRVTVTGIYRATPLRVNPRMRNVKAVYKTYIDVIQFCKDKSGRLAENTDKEDDQPMFTEERKQELMDLSKRDDIYDRLAKALAPSIYENEDVKKGILCQLFGASKKDFEDTGRNDMPAGQTPHTVVLYAHNDLVDSVQPGDRVTVTGIYRATPLRVNPRMRNVKAVYKTYIDVIQFCKDKSGRLAENTDKEDDQPMFTEERKQELMDLSKRDDIYDRLAKALAPSIYENEDVKKGILCQLFGASKKDFEDTGRSKFRSEINILLCGDPGTSKSQLLQYVHHLVPRGQYTSGKGSSAVGLTAYITKDPETRQLVLQTGALVLSDNGICCIDEFDKMNDSTRSVLHEVMEQQTLSIAKAGIICSLNARTSILAAANPVDSQWNPKKTIIDNIQLPHTLLSRFDLIFLILDPQDEIFDRRLANHLVSLYHQGKEESEDEHLDMAVMRDYISYARTYVNPKLTEESSQMLVQAYVEMRKIGSAKGMVSAYPRQLESLIRLGEAHARMRFSNKVEPVDVEEAKRLHYEALKQAAFDPRDGTINMDILGTGLSNTARKQQKECADAIKKYIDTNKGKQATFKYNTLMEEFRQQSDVPVPRDLFEGAVKLLVEDEYFFRSGNTLRKL